MTDSDYQIHELAQKAGVSVRTIRFYINEGLLPPPQVQGRYSTYSDEYLERLELIRLLKDQFLPLKEIRARMEGLSQAELRAALGLERDRARNFEADENKPAPESGGASALDYISQLLNRSDGRLEDARQMKISSPPVTRSKRGVAEAPGEYSPQPEAWERIQLAPGIELHVRKPVDRSLRTRLEQLVQFARQLFMD
jgi:DNA-binding transcriptional MerR regulator